MTINEILKDGFLFFDGAFGTMLQKRNLLALGEAPPVLNLTKPADITAIHNAYVEAGSDVATTNTFEANAIKLKDTPYTVEEVVEAAVGNARNSKAKYVALDIGPTGMLLKPMGTLSFEEAYDVFAQIVRAGTGADLIILETFSDLLEIKAALLAAKENSDLPVFASMTFGEDGRTFTGTDPVSAAITLQGLGADAVGVNCSLGPDKLKPIVEQILSVARVPVIVQANAGLPVIRDGETVYDITPDAYAKEVLDMAEMGASIIGGCCGTDPEYIKKITSALKGKRPHPVARDLPPAVTSSSQTVFLEPGVNVVGERINPTGKPRLKEALNSGSYDYILSEALAQRDEGADILDVNVGLPGIDEAKVLKEVVTDITGVCPLPLQIDSAKPKALEAAVRVYPGLPIINSVSGTKKSMDAVLPIAAQYGASVVALCLDEEGIPDTPEGRVAIARRIIEEAARYGIGKERIVVDALVLTASAQQDQALVTLETIRRLKDELGVPTTLGVSNISFGLPDRDGFNAVYLAAALGAGLNNPIMNPGSAAMQETIDVFKVLNSEDLGSEAYIKKYSGRTTQRVAAAPQGKDSVPADSGAGEDKDLAGYIISGMADAAGEETVKLLEEVSPQDIIERFFVPALKIVGDRYEAGEIFLPQLMQSAGAVQRAFGVIRDYNDRLGKRTESKGKVLLATVRGDIHDIGKNIVRMMLENYGYEVFDLGSDVTAEQIIEKVRERDIPLVGLSALMTTTVDSMKEIIERLKEEGLKVKVMVGGAVLTPEYSEMIDADFYGKDAQAAVNIANEFFETDVE